MSKYKEAARDVGSSSRSSGRTTDNDLSKHIAELIICPLCDKVMQQEGIDLFCKNCGYCTSALNIGFKYLTGKRRQL